ncbi:MAG TPA: AsmA family protein [Nitrospirales bacterium]|nr:AsmA family protein [Nitrospirales bacterium]
MSKTSSHQWLLMSVFGLFLLSGLAMILLMVFPGLIDLHSYKAYVLDQIESQLDETVEVSDISLSVFPGVQIELEHIALLDSENVMPAFSADRLVLNLRLLPLLRGEIVVKRVELDRPKINLRGERRGHLHFFDLHFFDLFPGVGDGGTPVTNVQWLSSSVREVAVRDGQIRFTPHGQSDGLSEIRIERVNTVITLPSDGTPLEFSVAGILPHDNGHAKINMTGTFSAQTIHSPVFAHSHVKYRLAGTTRISSLDLARLQPYLGTNDNRGLYGLGDFEGEMIVTIDPTSRQFSVQDVNLRLETVNLTGSVVFQQTNDKPWTFQSEVSTSPFDIRTALTVLSPRLDQTTFYNTVTEADVSGHARIVQASVSGALGMVSPSDIAVTAQFELESMRGRFGKGRVPFENVNASLILQDDTMELRSLTGRYGGAEVLNGIGIVTAMYDAADIDSTVTFRVPTAEFLDFFGEPGAPEEGADSMWGYESPTGGGRLTLEMAGSLHHHEVEFEGVFQSRGMGFHSAWAGLPVSKLVGQLNFSPSGVELSKVKGRIGRSRIRVNAQFAGDDSIIVLQSHADAKELVSLLLSKADLSPLSPDTLVRGTTLVNLRMERHADEAVISAKLDLKKMGYHGKSGTSKPAGVAASADVDVILNGDTQVKIQQIRFDLGPLLLTATGHVELTTPPQYSISVASNLVRLEEFHKRAPRVTIRGIHPKAGLFEARLKFTEVGGGRKAMGIDGEVSLLHGWMSVPETTRVKPLIIEDVNAALQFSREEDGRVEIGTLSALFNDSQVHVKGAITGLHVFPHVRVSIDAPQFDFESVIPRGKSSPLRELITSLSRTTILQSDIHVGTGQYNGVVWHDMHLAATGMDGVVTLEVLKAQSGDGSLRAHTTIHMPEDEPMQMDGYAQFTAVPAQDIVVLLNGDEHLMFGHADIKGELAGNGGHEDDMSATLDGQVNLTLSNGRIRKFTALSKMLNLLNLPQLLSGHVPDLSSKGLAFDSITATLIIEKGIMTIKGFSLNSPVIKIAGAGRYDIPSDNIDVVMAVSPLGSYESILKNIPVLNTIFAGGDQRRGILTVLFEVKGPLNDPEVTTMPVESVASGLTGLGELAIGILRNIISLPKELIVPTTP